MKFFPFLITSVILVACKTPRQSAENEPAEVEIVPQVKDFNLSTLPTPDNKIVSEPEVAVNRRNPSNIVAGSNYDNVYFSLDGGQHFTSDMLISKQFGVFGDPVLLSDESGNIYYFHLARDPETGEWLKAIIMQKSGDGGKTWTDGVAIGMNGKKHQDKPAAYYDPYRHRLAVAWTEFDKYGSHNPADKSRILISFSDDLGKAWTKPVKINDTDGDCLDSDNTVEGVVPVIDKKGNVYVVWAYKNKIWFDFSTDGGSTWHKDRALFSQQAGWDFDIRGFYRCNGLPSFVFDPEREQMFLAFGDRNQQHAFVQLSVSKDKGKTWSKPVRLSETPKDRFYGTLALIPEYKRVAVLYYDRSETSGDSLNVSLRLLDYQLQRRHKIRVNKQTFVPVGSVFLGDYIGLDYAGKTLAAVWAQNNDEADIHIAVYRVQTRKK